MKYSVKALHRNSEGFQHLAQKFLWMRTAKMKEQFFIGAQITEFANDRNLYEALEGTEKTWEAFRLFVDNFLCSHKAHLATGSWLRN
jgi:hypothetical protein